MLNTVKEILDACPTHGAGTLSAHASLCPNPEHRLLAEAYLEHCDNMEYLKKVSPCAFCESNCSKNF